MTKNTTRFLDMASLNHLADSRPLGIMLQIFIIILFRISSKFVSLCSFLFPKSTDYSHYSQLCCHTFTAFLHFCNQNVLYCNTL